jgi:hypothetical protein
VELWECERRVRVGVCIPASGRTGTIVGGGRRKGRCRGGEDDAIFAEIGEEGGGKREDDGFEGVGFVSLLVSSA